ncbi:hypothetical protein M0804_002059 [Polistes exclamans]|nr:hypothetical protein M0804_002059 [Polistes exclamans]
MKTTLQRPCGLTDKASDFGSEDCSSRVSAEPSPADEQQQQISTDLTRRLHREFKVHSIVIVNKISNELHHRTRILSYI